MGRLDDYVDGIMARSASVQSPFHDHHHDHDHCVADALARADRVCSRSGGRLTEIRRRVLEIVWASHRPVGAYDILQNLAAERGRVAPPTVYRALEFLVSHGLVHRIDRLNAFVGCPRPDEPHGAAFLICRACGEVAEVETELLDQAMRSIADQARFEVESRTVELSGLCRTCAEKGGEAA